jgi:radical SAM protein with 4Fe4S-binding SPASM domain
VYCYNSKERAEVEEKSLSLEIAKAGIDEYFAKNTSRHIRFYGPGEPMQEFELMKQITEYAKQKAGNAVTAELQTNGAFRPKVRKWILENLNIVWISFDGTADIQNAQRPMGNQLAPSAPLIEKNVKWLIANRGDRNLMVGARVTMTDLNVNRQTEMVDYFNSLGIKYIWTDPIFPEVKDKPVCEDLEREKIQFDMNAYVKNFIEAHRYAKTKGVFYGSFLTCNFDGEAKINCRACTPAPHITPDGYVSACDLVVLGSKDNHMNKVFIFGKWDDKNKKFNYEDYKDIIKALQERNVENMKHCQSCEAKLHCAGYCLGEVMNERGSLYGQKAHTCKAIKALYKELGACDTYDYMHP